MIRYFCQGYAKYMEYMVNQAALTFMPVPPDNDLKAG